MWCRKYLNALPILKLLYPEVEPSLPPPFTFLKVCKKLNWNKETKSDTEDWSNRLIYTHPPTSECFKYNKYIIIALIIQNYKDNHTTLLFSAKKPQSKSLCMVRILKLFFSLYMYQKYRWKRFQLCIIYWCTMKSLYPLSSKVIEKY